MLRLSPLLSLLILGLLGSCGRGLPPLRTWEVAEAPAGAQEVVFSFKAPYREAPEGYWDYKLGVVLPRDVDFCLSGEVKVYSTFDEMRSSFHFDKATRSSWLREESQVSHLLPQKLGIMDGEKWRVVVRFDRPLDRRTAIVLHFLSHQDISPQLIKD